MPTSTGDKHGPFQAFGNQPSEFWTDPFYSNRAAYPLRGPFGSYGYTHTPPGGGANGNDSGGGTGGGGTGTTPPPAGATPPPPVPPPTTGPNLPSGFDLKDILKLLAVSIPGLGMLLSGGGGGSNGDSALSTVAPQMKDMLSLQINQAKRSDPLHAALTQMAMNFLPRSSGSALPGRTDISRVAPYVPTRQP